MHVRCCFFALVLSTAILGVATAQTASPAKDNASCAADRADIERRMEVAQSKGQMLLRRQIADQLITLQAACEPPSAGQSRAANIARLEGEVRALRGELEALEGQLRKLKGEGNR
ncbi:uncharacterized protein DUF1090 [Acidovorax sp. 69]|uniref:DUF1090 family protein n=1 Tax=Acidovorax sp. 69 TaxID=2035202 RepID=UPI000C246DAD|nr:DUF1090 family protein [Acidovorax sp. 69]PJI98655.1 uncharacterized protein DUF1090 [Acidovorax sp. 69]